MTSSFFPPLKSKWCWVLFSRQKRERGQGYGRDEISLVPICQRLEERKWTDYKPYNADWQTHTYPTFSPALDQKYRIDLLLSRLLASRVVFFKINTICKKVARSHWKTMVFPSKPWFLHLASRLVHNCMICCCLFRPTKWYNIVCDWFLTVPNWLCSIDKQVKLLEPLIVGNRCKTFIGDVICAENSSIVSQCWLLPSHPTI